MTFKEIPIFKASSARWTTTIDLDSVVYQIAFHWNDREKAWYFSLNNADGVAIVAGIKLMVGIPTLKIYRSLPTLPPGEFLIVDVENNPITSKLDWDGLGVRYRFMYVSTTDEVA